MVVLYFAVGGDDGYHFPCNAQEEESANFLAHLPSLYYVLLVVDRSQMGPRWFRYVAMTTRVPVRYLPNTRFLWCSLFCGHGERFCPRDYVLVLRISGLWT